MKRLDILDLVAYSKDVKKVKKTKGYFERMMKHGGCKDFKQRADHDSRICEE